MAGAPVFSDSEGLEPPALDPIMLLAGALGPVAARSGAAMMRGIPEFAQSAPSILGNQMGGIRLGKARQMAAQIPTKPAELLTPAERQYKLWEATEKEYLRNNDFPQALRAKWGMLHNAGGN